MKINFQTNSEKLTGDNHNDEYILKYYFNDYPLPFRDEVRSKARVLAKHLGTSLSEEIYNIRVRVDEETKKDLPFLIDSIILNSLAFEANENLEKTVYKDYQEKSIKKYGKFFIKGQYQIYEQNQNRLFMKAEEETQHVIRSTQKIILLIKRIGLSNFHDIENILIANEIDSKSIQGIAKKILKNRK